MIAAITYILCSLTALLCSLLLFRGFRRNKARLLFWSGISFLFLFLENIVLFIDMVLIPEVSLSSVQLLPGVISVVSLLYGLMLETE